MEYSGLLNEIDKLIQLIDEIASLYLQGKEAAPKQLFPALMEQVGVVFPTIVETYQTEEMSAVRDDYIYWVNQLNRIAEILSADDKFLILDILLFETKENLIQFQTYFDETRQG